MTPESQHVINAEYAVAEAYERLALYERAAAAYEGFAQAHGVGEEADERAPQAMLAAVFIRTGLGQDERAREDVDFLELRFGGSPRFRQVAAQAYFAIGEAYVSAADWAQVARHYTEYLARYGDDGGKDLETRIWRSARRCSLPRGGGSKVVVGSGPAQQRCVLVGQAGSRRMTTPRAHWLP